MATFHEKSTTHADTKNKKKLEKGKIFSKKFCFCLSSIYVLSTLLYKNQ